MIHCPVTISLPPTPFNSKIPPKTVGTEKSQNSQSNNGYVPRVSYNLDFCFWVCPRRLCFHSHKPGQGRYLSESPVKNIHTPKPKMINPGLANLVGDDENRRATSLISRTAQHFLKVLPLDWPVLEIPPSHFPHWTGIQVPLITSTTLNTVFYSLNVVSIFAVSSLVPN